MEKLIELQKNLIDLVNTGSLGYKKDSYDILAFANIQAAFDSAAYYNEKMSKAQNFENDLALLSHAVAIRNLEGQILEFGVASGRTINHISSLIPQQIYGFDVFTGLPEAWRTGFPKGIFKQQELPIVNKNVELITGLFESSIDDHLKRHHQSIALLHIDCDLYSSTKTIFKKLVHLIRPGTVIVFDEYLNFPGWRQYEFKAFQEFIEENKIKYKYDSFVSTHQQVCVVIE